MLALDGIKILDLSRTVPSSFCTMILGDLGAEVIKVESPKTPEWAGSGRSPKEGIREAAYFAPNRNKKSIGLNLMSEAGRQIFYRLASQTDVIVEGFRPGVAKRLGVDYDIINKLNPAIIYCSLSGYGQDGPYSNLPGHDLNYIATAGALDLIGPSDGPPVIPLNFVADFAGASLYGAIGILAALMARDKTDKGQFVDIAYTDGAIALTTFFTTSYFRNGIFAKRGETALHGVYPYYGIYETKDAKYITIGCIEPHFWKNLCRLWGREDYIPYHFTPDHFVHKPEDEKWEEIHLSLQQYFLTKTMDEWFELLSQNDIPAGKVNTIAEASADPQVLHRQMVIDVEHPSLGKVRQVGIAPKLTGTPGKVRSLSPLLGEHTNEVLQGLGYSHTDIDNLRQEGTVA